MHTTSSWRDSASRASICCLECCAERGLTPSFRGSQSPGSLRSHAGVGSHSRGARAAGGGWKCQGPGPRTTGGGWRDERNHVGGRVRAFLMMMATGNLGPQPSVGAGPSQETLNFLASLKLTNVVATVNLDCKPDLKSIALGARNAEFNPRRFPAVIMHIKEPKSCALIFGSGKMVVTGTRSEEDSRRAAQKYTIILKKLQCAASCTEFKIQNMTASCAIGFPIRLEGLVTDQPRFCSYEPELFPGLVYRMYSPKVVLLIFVSGRIIITGAKSKRDMEIALEKLHPILMEYRKIPQAQLVQSAGAVNGT